MSIPCIKTWKSELWLQWLSQGRWGWRATEEGEDGRELILENNQEVLRGPSTVTSETTNS